MQKSRTAYAIAGLLILMIGDERGSAQTLRPQVGESNAESSVEQGRTPLIDSFKMGPEWRREKRREAWEETEFRINLRTFYFDRDKFDGSQSQAWAIGGSAGVKSGYFLDHFAFGVTGYTSQKLIGDRDKDGTSLLAPGQEGYTVLGEAYLDVQITDDLNFFIGRKEYDSPYINRDDTRMTPNTFEAVAFQGKTNLGENNAIIRYGGGYFYRIKERNSDQFVPMSEVTGANVDRGVFAAGALYKNDTFSIGVIDYLCPGVLNIGYAETTLKYSITEGVRPTFSAQFTDQRSLGQMPGDEFSVQQLGFKADLPLSKALFTVACTYTTDGADMLSPWSGYPGYTSVQVQEFNRAGEAAFLVRAGYEFSFLQGLSAYALGVFGVKPDEKGQYRQNEYDFNVQWAPPEGVLKGLSLRFRYAIVEQFGGTSNNIEDCRVIGNYAINF